MTAWLSPAPVAFLFLSVSPPPQLVVRSRTAPRSPLSPPLFPICTPRFIASSLTSVDFARPINGRELNRGSCHKIPLFQVGEVGFVSVPRLITRICPCTNRSLTL